MRGETDHSEFVYRASMEGLMQVALLDVARGFFRGAEPGMANAALDWLARVLRPGEFGE